MKGPPLMRRLLPAPPDVVDPVEAYGRLGRTQDGRPRVRLNMIASVDGAASVAGRSGGLGGMADKALFFTLRSLADVIMVGAATMRTEGYGPARLDHEARARRANQGLTPVPPIAVVTRTCRLPWDAAFFTQAEQQPIVVTTAVANVADRNRAAAKADVVVAGDANVDLSRALAALGDRGAENVLVEGGPHLAGQMVESGLLDELCLTVAPLASSGDAGRILAGPVLVPATRFELHHVLEADGYLFLRYQQQ